LWFLGYPEQALTRSAEALTLAHELSHPHTMALALTHTAMVHQYRREAQRVQERAEAVMTLATDQGFPLWLAFGTMLRGWTLTEQGQGAEGTTRLHEGLAACQAIGAGAARTYFLALLAEAYGKGGKAEDGLTTLAEALAAVARTEERWY